MRGILQKALFVCSGRKATMYTFVYVFRNGIGGIGFKLIKEDINMNDEMFLSSSSIISKERIEYNLKPLEKNRTFYDVWLYGRNRI